jgi:2-dehydropantoate 2-reductase
MIETNRSRPRIAFMGTGAQGASVAADLALAGHDVTFIDQWPAHIEAIRANGITVNLPTRTINAPVPALHLCDVAEIRQPFDIVFIVVKGYDTRWATELIKPVVADDGLVVALQNGMTHEVVADVMGPERTIGAVIQIASNMWEPGLTNRENDHDTSWFGIGAVDPKTQHRAQDIADLLALSGRTEVTDDIHSVKWMKVVVNAAELIPSAIVNQPLATSIKTPGMLKAMRAAGYEAMQAALADGAKVVNIIGMPPVRTNDPDRFVDAIYDEVLTTFSTETTLVTSLQDWRKGRRAEVQEINGLVVDRLAARGVDAPINRRIVELGLEIEAGRLDAKPENAGAMIAVHRANLTDA